MAAQPLPQPPPQLPRPQLPPPVAPTSPPASSAALKTRARAPLLTGSSDVHKVAQPSLLSSEEYAGAPCRRPVPACDGRPGAPPCCHKTLSYCLPDYQAKSLCPVLDKLHSNGTATYSVGQCSERQRARTRSGISVRAV